MKLMIAARYEEEHGSAVKPPIAGSSARGQNLGLESCCMWLPGPDKVKTNMNIYITMV